MLCCIDTSGYFDDKLLHAFFGELEGILNPYPTLQCQLWYADARCHGPCTLQAIWNIPRPRGGGGTDFTPFFRAAADHWSHDEDAVCVYLTDGYGGFPEEPPEMPVLWVVTPGGAEAKVFPFGEVCRLLA